MLSNVARLVNTIETALRLVTASRAVIATLLALVGALAVFLAAASPAPAQEALTSTWQIVWQQELPFLTAEPQVADGMVRAFAGNTVVSLDLSTGAPIWRVQPPPPQGRALLLGCCQTGAVPTETGLYTLAGGNEVWALDSGSGATRWRRALGEAIVSPPAVAPTAVGVLTLAGLESVLYALDPSTGETLWQLHPGPARALPLLAAAGDTLFVPLSSGSTVAYAASDGRQLWSSAADARSALISAQQVSDTLLVLATDTGVVALDRASGAERWRAQLPELPLEPRVLGGSVYARTVGGTIIALDASDGTERWRSEVGTLRRQALSGPTGGRLLAAGEDGVAALEAATGRQAWERPSEAVVAAPLATGDVVYIGTVAGDLLVLDAATGTEHARLPLGGHIVESPTLSPDGLVLVATEGQTGSGLFAIRRGEIEP